MPKKAAGGKGQPNMHTEGVGIKAILALPADRRSAIDSYLLSDHPVPKLTAIVRDEWGLFLDTTFDATKRSLYRYKEKYINPKQAAIAAKHSSVEGLQKLAVQVQDMSTRMNPLVQLEQLVAQQTTRVTKLYELEVKMPALLEAQTKNIALLGGMLKDLAQLQLETGELVRVPKKAQTSALDVSEEERSFIEASKLTTSKAEVVMEAMKFLANAGVIGVEDAEVVEEDEDRTRAPVQVSRP